MISRFLRGIEALVSLDKERKKGIGVVDGTVLSFWWNGKK
jgi:hypothetical protein